MPQDFMGPGGPGENPDPNQQPQQAQQDVIPRGEPRIAPPRKKLVEKWQSTIKADKKHWQSAFDQMRDDQDFVRGRQWSKDWNDDRYVANIALRHVQQRVAALYARNPTIVAKRRERLMSSVWDGTMSGVMLAMQQLQQIQPGAMQDPSAMMTPMQTLQEAQQDVEYRAQMDKFGKTLELLYEYNLDEQAHAFKSMMKLVVRRAVTTGVGYVKLGFQRVMERRPEVEARIADMTRQMQNVQRIAADYADGKLEDKDNSAQLETLRLQLQALQEQQEILVREGIILDYPESTAIIPDRNTRQLKDFLGSDHVTQEYLLTPDEVKDIYQVDVGAAGYRSYRQGTTEDPTVSPVIEESGHMTFDLAEDDSTKRRGDQNLCIVWETYDRDTGLVYVTCDGYKDFLQEPSPPDVWTENFYPWFALVLNECDHPEKIYPPSDVTLIRHQQMEYNRLREGLREHRIANRPAIVAAGGMLSESDTEKLLNRPANAIVELDGLQPGQSVDQLLQALRPPGVDPNLYEVNSIFEDVLRSVGVQEANLGAVSGGTATESSIAESARQSSLSSNVDDLDDMLTRMARAAGQILLAEVSLETVQEVVGPGAVWPELSREQLAKEIFLEVEAGSTGRPNQAAEIQNFERLAPLLMQIPGVSPELLAKEGLRRLDDRLKLAELYDPNQLSIMAMNQMATQPAPGGGAGAGPESDPAAQGPQGADNAPRPTPPAGQSAEGSRPPPRVA